MTQLLIVMLGGGAGAAARFVVDAWVRSRSRGLFPLGTVTVNVTGSFLIGLVTGAALAAQWSPNLVAPLTVGFCGGYTTFSSAVLESVRLLQAGAIRSAVGNLVASLVLTVAAVAAGLPVGRLLTA